MERRRSFEDDDNHFFLEPFGEPLEGEPDETTDENVRYTLDALEIEIDTELELVTYHTMGLAQRASEELSRVGLADEIKVEDYVELCKELDVVPESEVGLFAVEDIFFKIQHGDYINRDVSDTISVDDLMEESEITEYEEYVQKINDAAVTRLSGLIIDPILEYRMLRIRLADLKEKSQASVEVFDELQTEIIKTEKELGDIISAKGIPQINERRERGLRRLDWLLRQDFMQSIVKDLERRMQTEQALSLTQAIERIAVSRGVDQKAMRVAYVLRNQQIAQVEAKKVELLAQFEDNKITPQKMSEETERIDKLLAALRDREPEIKNLTSIVDHLIELEKEGSNREGFTRKQKRRAQLRDDRLQQAKELCETVFAPDLKDRIYELVNISERELERVELMHRLVHEKADLSSFERILELMPGGSEAITQLEEVEEVAANKTEALEYGGKMRLEIMEDIADIINEDGEYEDTELQTLQQLRRLGQLNTEQAIELGEIAVKVMKALVFRHNTPISKLT